MKCLYSNANLEEVRINIYVKDPLTSPDSVESEFGWVDHKFVSDVALYQKSKAFDGHRLFIWRQGVKHDCSKIFELKMVNNKYINDFTEELTLEDDLILGLAKSSDIQSPLISMPRKYIILTQKRVGEDTSYPADKYPNIHGYLTANIYLFLREKVKHL